MNSELIIDVTPQANLPEKLSKLQRERSNLLPIEAEYGRELDEKINQVKSSIKTSEKGFKLVSLDIFKMRNKEGHPTFGIFSPEVNKCVFGNQQNHYEWPDALPKECRIFYKDVIDSLEIGTLGGMKYKNIEALFPGRIPQNIREAIVKNKSKFKNVLIFAEIEKWHVTNENEVRFHTDPIVAGWDGDTLYYIDSYDLTPNEDYIKKEFLS